MAVQFQDYYDTLGIKRDATAEEITKAYRKLARKLHPDVNKAKDAEDKFKQINEAHEVLKNPETRKRYDALGKNWKAGEQFTPPPGWENIFNEGFSSSAGPRNGMRFESGGMGFSDFFNMLFGGSSAFGGADLGGYFRGEPGASGFAQATDLAADLEVSLEEMSSLASKQISLSSPDPQTGQPQRRNYQVRIPPGISDGKVIRLVGQGVKSGKGPAGDLLLTVRIKKHPLFWTEGSTVYTKLKLSPWEAALGAKITVPTLGGSITLRIPAGAQSGQALQVRGKGLPLSKDKFGDMRVLLQVSIPQELSIKERELFESLARESKFNPRH